MVHQDTQKTTKIPKRAFTKPSITAIVFFVLIVILLVPNTLPLFANMASTQLFALVFFSPLIIPGLICAYYSGLSLAKIVRRKIGGSLLASFSAMLILHIVCVMVCIGVEKVIAGYPFQMCFDVCQKVEMSTAVTSYLLFSIPLFLPAYYVLCRYAVWTREGASVGRDRGLKTALVIVSAMAICGIGFSISERIELNNKIDTINEYEEWVSDLQGQFVIKSAEENEPVVDTAEEKLVAEINPYRPFSAINLDRSKCLGKCDAIYKRLSGTTRRGFLRYNTQNDSGEIEVDSDGQGMLYGEYKIDFDSEVVDVYWGVEGDATVLLFLKLDGTVDFSMPYPTPYPGGPNGGEGEIKKYSLEGVEDVVYFMQVMRIGDSASTVTTLAFRSDGYFYDLSEAIKKARRI